MWQTTKLDIVNLASHKHTAWEFNLGGVRLIQGENLDDTGQKSNGSGKSIIAEGIILAYTGEPFRKVGVKHLIRDNEEETIINLYQINKKLGIDLRIERRLYREKSQVCKIWINDIEEKQSGITEYNKRILELIDISKEDLLNYFIVHKDKFVSFFGTGDTKQKEIIARFSGADVLKGIDKLVESELISLDDKIKPLENEINTKKGKILVYNEQKKEIEDEDLETKKLQSLLDLKNQSISKEKLITTLEHNITESNHNIKHLNNLKK